jgi:hypothetical protein
MGIEPVSNREQEMAMRTGTRTDLAKHVVARLFAFIGLTAVSAVLIAVPYVALN